MQISEVTSSAFQFAKSELLACSRSSPYLCVARAFPICINIRHQYIDVSISFNFFVSSKAFPVPSATHDNGSSAMDTGSPVA